jgi:D-glycero-beta-D-manno-heptose 1-phosphate adenylyltransferase
MEKVVFTNGCFDLIHPGHIDLLKKARALGTKLIVGLNSDDSVRAIKGNSRPFLNQEARAKVLLELRSVDEVRIFDENTPEKLIKEIKPDVLVKGGDWAIEQIVGADFVLKNGGEVFSIPFVEDFSTSKIAQKIKFADGANSVLKKNTENDLVEDFFKANIGIYENLLNEQSVNISRCAEIIIKAIKNGNKIFVCGEPENVENLRFWFSTFSALTDKETFPAHLLTGEAIQDLEQLAAKNDILISLTTSNTPPGVITAVMKAREIGCKTVALTGKNSIKLASLCDGSVSAASEDREIAQLAQIGVGCLWRRILKKI